MRGRMLRVGERESQQQQQHVMSLLPCVHHYVKTSSSSTWRRIYTPKHTYIHIYQPASTPTSQQFEAVLRQGVCCIRHLAQQAAHTLTRSSSSRGQARQVLQGRGHGQTLEGSL